MSCGMGETVPPNPDLLVTFVVRMFEALPVADDGPPAANRAAPREHPQRDIGHPGSVFSVSGSAIKRTTVGLKASADRPATSNAQADRPPPVSQSRTKKEYRLSLASGTTLVKL
jgi:hypothetical protein